MAAVVAEYGSASCSMATQLVASASEVAVAVVDHGGELLRQWAVSVAQEVPQNNSKLTASWFLSPQQVRCRRRCCLRCRGFIVSLLVTVPGVVI